jgi:hypothetical protein
MASSQVPATGGSLNNWELISTATLSAATSFSFSSISGYQSLKVIWASNSFSNLNACLINNDNGSNYNYVGMTPTVSFGPGGAFAATALQGSTSYTNFDWTILNCNNSNLKTYTIDAFYGGNTSVNFKGNYLASAAVTSLDFTFSAAVTATAKLYGVRP